jgi:hypothetical protein
VVIGEAWIRGLLLRETSSFNDRTRRLLASLVVLGPNDAVYPLSNMRRLALRTAVSLSVHPEQPLGSGWLHSWLAPMSMPDRDRRWTSQLGDNRGIRRSLRPNPFQQLMDWIRTAPPGALQTVCSDGSTTAQQAAETLLWALPSPDRFLRDRATRAILATVEHDPGIVARLLDLAVDIDDGYVVERVLAVTCAAVTIGAVEAEPAAAAVRRFIEEAGLPCHVLSRDYLATTVTRLAVMRSANADVAFLQSTVLPPYPATWPGPLGTPEFDRLKIKYPGILIELIPDDTTTGTDPSSSPRMRVPEADYLGLIHSLDRLGDFRTYIMHVELPSAFPFAAQRLDEASGEPLNDFATSLLPGWVFARAIELGWHPESFAAIDAAIDHQRHYETHVLPALAADAGIELGKTAGTFTAAAADSRSAHKPERFGKKYQWLAWHEALARISGTHQLKDRDNSRTATAYHGAWQLDARDFDPTHLLDRQKLSPPRWWQELWTTPAPPTATTVAAASDGTDGPVDYPSASTPPEPWWFPLPALELPVLPFNRDPIMALSDWALDPSDLPNIADFLVVEADVVRRHARGQTEQLRPGRRFRLLNAVRRYDEPIDNRDVARGCVVITVDGLLIRRDDLAALTNWRGTDPLDGRRLDVAFTNALFLGEWPTGEVYRANCSPEFRPLHWRDATEDVLGIGAPTIVMTERYCWEGGTYDCSLNETLNVRLLGAAAAALFPGVRHRQGTGRTADGQLLHLDPDPTPGHDGGLLIDEATLAVALQREGLVLVQAISQWKQVNLPASDHRFAGQVIQTRLVGSVGAETLFDQTSYHRRDPRLD